MQHYLKKYIYIYVYVLIISAGLHWYHIYEYNVLPSNFAYFNSLIYPSDHTNDGLLNFPYFNGLYELLSFLYIPLGLVNT